MADLLETGATKMAALFTSHGSTSVVYNRGVESVTVSATIGRTEFDLERDEVVVKQDSAKDFLIAAADLVLDGCQIEPQKGDLVRHVVGGVSKIYKVGEVRGLPAFEPADQYGITLRIHAFEQGKDV